jgi:short-subunit dehydrogenase
MTKTALITGASSGIGAALARIHAERQGNLVLVARRKDRLETLKTEIEQSHGVSVIVIAEDLTDPNAPRRIHAAVMPWSQIQSMIDVNATALAGLTHAFLPGFVARNAGCVLNVTSTTSEMPGPMQAIYLATKSFTAYLSNALVEELSDTEVTVTNFMPTATASEFAEVAGMANTPLFKSTSSAREVVQDGYDAMLRGDMDAYGGMRPKRRLMQMLIKMMPKRAALRAIRQAQEATVS